MSTATAPAEHETAEALVLAWVNEVREALGLRPAPALRRGEPLNPWWCPVCRTLREWGLTPCFTGEDLTVYRGHEVVLERRAPEAVRRWSDALDCGEVPAYAIGPARARR